MIIVIQYIRDFLEQMERRYMASFLTPEAYLGELLERYRANFDITSDYSIGNRTYEAYARFFSLGEKYVLKKEAKLWAIRAYEHVFFMTGDSVSVSDLSEIRRAIEDDIEPGLVRNGEKYPEKDHMSSYLTFVIICAKTPDDEVKKAIKKFSYDKGYLLGFRGHSQARIGCAFLDSESVLTNYAGKELKKLLTNIFTM